jgi:hypothetical protein
MYLKEVKLVVVDGLNYLLTNEIDENGYCAYGVNGNTYVKKYNDTLDESPDWIMGVIAEPQNIGLVYEQQLNDEVCLLSHINKTHIEQILKNNGSCYIETQEPLHHNKSDIHPKDIKLNPIFVDGKIVLRVN